MPETQQQRPSESQTEFEQLRDEKQVPLLQECITFIRENKQWWMIPILLVMSLVSLLVILGSTGAAPFIYTLF